MDRVVPASPCSADPDPKRIPVEKDTHPSGGWRGHSRSADCKTPKEFAASSNKLEKLEGGIPAKFIQLAEDAHVCKVVLQD